MDKEEKELIWNALESLQQEVYGLKRAIDVLYKNFNELQKKVGGE